MKAFVAVTLVSIACTSFAGEEGTTIIATVDSSGTHEATALIPPPSSVTCISATGDSGPTAIKPSCFIQAPGYRGAVQVKQSIGTSVGGTVTLGCNGSGNLRCTARITP